MEHHGARREAHRGVSCQYFYHRIKVTPTNKPRDLLGVEMAHDSVDDHLKTLVSVHHIFKRISQSAKQNLGSPITDYQHGRPLKEAPEGTLATVSKLVPAECPECASDRADGSRDQIYNYVISCIHMRSQTEIRVRCRGGGRCFVFSGRFPNNCAVLLAGGSDLAAPRATPGTGRLAEE